MELLLTGLKKSLDSNAAVKREALSTAIICLYHSNQLIAL